RTLGRSHTICRYYIRGICRFGELCRFSHDLGDAGHPEIGEVVPAESPRPSTTSRSSHSIDQPQNWVNAQVFVPSQKGLAFSAQEPQAKTETNIDIDMKAPSELEFQPIASWAELLGQYPTLIEPASVDEVCPYGITPCLWKEHCPYRIHMELCEMCQQYCMHPTDQDQRKVHIRECLEEHEEAMELSFAVARSQDKTCGICFDTIMEKTGREKRFGILPNCIHIFCLECIRTWRQTKFDHKITRACPECRVSSDFVCPSVFWVETKEDKEKLLNNYRHVLGTKDCKYFKNGEGKCPFGNKCFYKH
ncbi:hypothetical protein KR059_005463, partial [Drosophila kikkawai]